MYEILVIMRNECIHMRGNLLEKTYARYMKHLMMLGNVLNPLYSIWGWKPFEAPACSVPICVSSSASPPKILIFPDMLNQKVYRR